MPTRPRHQRLNVTLPRETIALVERSAAPKRRSEFIAEAIHAHAERLRLQQLAERLQAGYLARAERDRRIAEEWRPLEEETHEIYVDGRRRARK